MRKRVYVETSIPSFYWEVRPEPDMQARRAWTRTWWDNHAREYDLVTSMAVIDELARGDHPQQEEVLGLAKTLPLVSITDELVEIVDFYVHHRVMPADPRGDALHLALASVHHCHFLLTWNCTHLANANKFEHIRHVNSLLGLPVPTLATPLQLLEPEGEEGEDR